MGEVVVSRNMKGGGDGLQDRSSPTPVSPSSTLASPPPPAHFTSPTGGPLWTGRGSTMTPRLGLRTGHLGPLQRAQPTHLWPLSGFDFAAHTSPFHS